ncbi:MAG: PilZ domain-containing protein [Treponema sp.]|jgi:hypothetical protein|nr:PilZ domain-containing protein [Treponema sp.]
MGVLTSQKIATFYERFKEIDVTYTKEVIQVTGLQSKQVYLKCVSDVWPCVIYSSSFQGAKIAVNIKSGLIAKLQQANNMVSVRFCFKDPNGGEQVTFFVSARSVGYAPYGGSQDVALFSVQFTQRPPDDLIEIMGRLLDANFNSTKRKDEWITLNAENIRRLNLLSGEAAVFMQGVPRRCILRDISFSGARIVIMGILKFLLDKEVSIKLNFNEPRQSYLIKGKFTKAENVESRKDLLVMNLVFDDGAVPMGYRVRLSDYFGTVRPASDSSDKGGAKKSAPSKPAAAPLPQAKGNEGASTGGGKVQPAETVKNINPAGKA